MGKLVCNSTKKYVKKIKTKIKEIKAKLSLNKKVENPNDKSLVVSD